MAYFFLQIPTAAVSDNNGGKVKYNLSLPLFAKLPYNLFISFSDAKVCIPGVNGGR